MIFQLNMDIFVPQICNFFHPPQFVLDTALAVIAIISIGFFTTNLHYKIQILEDQLRSKIGEYNSIYLAR